MQKKNKDIYSLKTAEGIVESMQYFLLFYVLEVEVSVSSFQNKESMRK